MNTIKDPFMTTIRRLRTTANVQAQVRRIQSKIFEYGVASDDEMAYLRQHTDWDKVNPRVKSNLG